MQDNAISAAEGGQERVTHAPVDASKIPEATGDCGLGGITPPGTAAKVCLCVVCVCSCIAPPAGCLHLAGVWTCMPASGVRPQQVARVCAFWLQGGVLCVAEVTAAASDGVFTVAEAPSEVAAQPSSGILPLGHAVDLNGVPAEAHRRRRLLQASTAAAASSAGSFASAVATSSGTATAIATADGTSSTNGTALAVSRAAATDNSTAVAVSNATSVGNSTVTAVANANATDGGTAVAQSAVEGKGVWRQHHASRQHCPGGLPGLTAVSCCNPHKRTQVVRTPQWWSTLRPMARTSRACCPCRRPAASSTGAARRRLARLPRRPHQQGSLSSCRHRPPTTALRPRQTQAPSAPVQQPRPTHPTRPRLPLPTWPPHPAHCPTMCSRAPGPRRSSAVSSRTRPTPCRTRWGGCGALRQTPSRRAHSASWTAAPRSTLATSRCVCLRNRGGLMGHGWAGLAGLAAAAPAGICRGLRLTPALALILCAAADQLCDRAGLQR
jgi:hypothetical protein